MSAVLATASIRMSVATKRPERLSDTGPSTLVSADEADIPGTRPRR